MCFGTASVQAADLAAHYTKAPVMTPVYNWTGFYVGGNVGGQWGSANPATFDGVLPVAAYFAACERDPPSERSVPSTSTAPA